VHEASPSPYRHILKYFPRHWRVLAAGAFCVVAGRLLLVYAPMLLREVLRVLEARGPDTLDNATRATWAFLGVSVAAGFFTWAQRLLLIGTSRRVERDFKRDLFAHIERLPVSFFDRTRAGDLLSRLTSDVEAVRWIVGPGPMYVSSTLVLFPMALLAMMQLSVEVTLAALVPLLGIVLVVRLVAPGIMRLSRAVQDRIGDLSARAQESFAGARVVRAYATEDVEIAAFERENRLLVKETLGLARRRAVLQGTVYMLGGLAQLAVLVYGGHLVLEGALGFGDLVAFLAYVLMLVWPMISVGWVVSAIQRAAAAIQRIDEVMSEPPEERVLVEPAVEPALGADAVRVEDLTFRYPGTERPALEDVSLGIHGGGTLALVGPVGGGKSTLLSLLTRTYDPPPGTVFLDGADVTRIPLDRLRDAFTVVPQDAFLFSDTLLGNLAYGLEEEAHRERVLAAATSAGLEADIQAFPRGLDTVVGERGVTLSGGQKQRATLARALLRDAPILLLDDALSSVDTETEERILEGLRRELRKRTVLIVAHRLSTIRDADHIVVLAEGRVTESGSHEELLERGGWYARTWQHQRLEAELENLP
jgi:ATP-binding cassette subfamily B protein